MAATLLCWRSDGGARLDDQSLLLLRGQLGSILTGTVFLFVGLSACVIGTIRRRGEFRILEWFGLFIGMYGTRMLVEAASILRVAPNSGWPPAVIVIIDYLLVVPALLFWAELGTGSFRRLSQMGALAGVGIAIVGLGLFFTTGSDGKVRPYNSLLAIGMLLVVGIVAVVPQFSRKFLVIQSRVLAVCMPVIFSVAMYVNLGGLLGFRPLTNLEPPAFALFVCSIGYVAAQKVFANERRLLSIESELEIARRIQTSILPTTIPEVNHLRIAVSYRPMTAVAGDFYEFIQVDQHRVGVLVADVSGHGVPAALIASMIKVAVQSVGSCAHEPAEVLGGLNRILSGQLREQFVSAAYLWVDTEIATAWYSAAGHPPLLCWREGSLERIESNGLLFGVAAESDYPVRGMPLHSGDRFLLYTDGVVEPENAAGDSFGDCKLEQVVRSSQSRSPVEFSSQLLSEIRRWQPASMTQQDDITLIVIDVV